MDIQNENSQFLTCDHEYVLLVQIQSNNSDCLKEICKKCGNSGQVLKRSSVSKEAYAKLPRRTTEQINDYRSKVWKEKSHQIQERAEKKRQEWREWYYGEYLHSEEWAHKREKVLRRDQYICQGCLKAEATIVHHLSYEHVWLRHAQEFCFELISLCQECHEQVHHLKEEPE